jgi:hypothetical protein
MAGGTEMSLSLLQKSGCCETQISAAVKTQDTHVVPPLPATVRLSMQLKAFAGDDQFAPHARVFLSYYAVRWHVTSFVLTACPAQ